MRRNRSVPSSSVIPILPYPDVREGTEWLCRVFGFVERLRIAAHRAQLNIGGDGAMIVAEYIDRTRRPERGADHVSHQIMVRVEDVDAHHDHAVREGAEILQALVDQPFGERQYAVRDIGGHRWTFSQTLASDTGGTIDTSGTVDTVATTDANGDGTNATCATCAMTSCSTQLAACNADTACKCTYDCKLMGGAEGSCKAMCSANNNTAWSDMVGCLDSMCAGSC